MLREFFSYSAASRLLTADCKAQVNQGRQREAPVHRDIQNNFLQPTQRVQRRIRQLTCLHAQQRPDLSFGQNGRSLLHPTDSAYVNRSLRHSHLAFPYFAPLLMIVAPLRRTLLSSHQCLHDESLQRQMATHTLRLVLELPHILDYKTLCVP